MASESMRELFHSLGNKHNLITIGCGITKELIEECLEEKDIPQSLKDRLRTVINNLNGIVKNAVEADNKTREIHDKVYAIIDPDTGKPK